METNRSGLIILAMLSLIVGAVSGLVCALFRLTLQQADWLRSTFIAWAHGQGFAALLLVVAVLAAAGVPGGLFAPMLVLGAQIGLIFGSLCDHWLPGVASTPTAYAIVGMAAFFTAVVRAPLTGIVLATEMTGSASLLLPMLASCFAAMAVPTLLRVPPIYDSLKPRIRGQT